MTDTNCEISLGSDCRKLLLRLARTSIETGLANATPTALPPEHISPDLAPAARDKHACFVTLRVRSVLRGCCGTLRARRRLVEDVWRNAHASAFHDYRMPAVVESELAELNIQISLLSPMERLHVGSQAELVEMLCPGRDGVLLEVGEKRATYLPAVWEALESPDAYLAELKTKAGLASDFWSERIQWYRYRTQSFSE